MTNNLKPTRLFLKQFTILALATLSGVYANAQLSITDTFNFTGAVQTFVVPQGVDSITVDIYGAQGGISYYNLGAHNNVPGLGGRLVAKIPVTPGETLSLYVGGAGADGTTLVSGAGGYNGGGYGGYYGISNSGGGGGGATDIRSGGSALTNRIVVAGAGGGAGFNTTTGQNGGGGGGTTGLNGYFNSSNSDAAAGKGGTSSNGGAGAQDMSWPASANGSLGNGSDGASTTVGGGGGGGFYGGSGGSFGGGGGGSSYAIATANGVVHTQGVQSGNGVIFISYAKCSLPTLPTTFVINTHSRESTITSVNVGGTGNNVAFVAPGATVSLSFDWAVAQNGTYCPGCVFQRYIGIHGYWSSCYLNSGGYCNCSGSHSINFTAPTIPGIYYITHGAGLDYACAPTVNSAANNTNGLAAIIVRESFTTSFANETCVGSNDGFAMVTPDHATTGNTYLWSNANTTSSITTSGAAVYNVTSSDTFGCFQIDTIQIFTDTLLPTILVDSIQLYLNAGGTATLVADSLDAGTWDSCGVASISINQSVFTCDDVGVNWVWFKATDYSGFADSVQVVVLVKDTTTYSVSCLSDTTLNLSNDSCSIPFSYAASVNEICGDSLILVSGLVSGSAFPIGVTTNVNYHLDKSMDFVFYGFDDLSLGPIDGQDNWSVVGNTGIAQSIISMRAASGEKAKSQGLHLGDLGASNHLWTTRINDANWSTPAFDTNDVIVMQFDNLRQYWGTHLGFGVDENSDGDIVDNELSFAIGDATVSGTFILYGPDHTSLATFATASTWSRLKLTVDLLAKTLSFSYRDLTNSGNWIAPASMQNISVAFDYSATGNYNPTLIDGMVYFHEAGEGNDMDNILFGVHKREICSFDVTVLDTFAPTVIPRNINVYLDSFGNASINPNDVDSNTHDNCAVNSLTIDIDSFGCGNIGSPIQIVLTASDSSGNIDTAHAYVTVLDTTAPKVITQNITVALDNQGYASITSALINNGSWDSCGLASFSLDIDSFNCGNVGANTVTLSATDIHGNTSSATAIVTIIDTIAPMVNTINSVVVFLDSSGHYTLNPLTIDSGSWDSCGITFSLSQSNFDCSDISQNNYIILTVSDPNGNSAIDSTVVVVLDSIAPTIITQSIVVTLDSNGNATINPDSLDNGTWDACGIDTIYISNGYFGCNDTASNFVTFYAIDIYGNIDSQVVTVTVIEVTPPTVLTQDTVVYLNSSGNASISVAMIDSGSFDSCGISSIWLDNYDFDCSNVGSNTVTLYVQDINGNVDSAQATVTVYDDILPTVITQNISIYLDSFGQTSIVALDVDNGSWDSCGIASYSVDSSNFSCANVGTPVTVTLTVTDVNGNTDSSQCVVTVLDTIAPQVITQNLTAYLDSFGNTSITTTMVNAGSWDSCGINTLTLDTSNFSCADIGTNTVTLSVEDIHSNTSSATAIITVLDTIAPEVITQNLVVYLDSSGSVTITPSQVDSGSWDSCGIVSMVLDTTTYACSDTGIHTVTLTLTDINGNISSNTATVTVEDNLAPIVLTQNVTVYLDAAGSASITAGMIDSGSTDNCAIDTMLLDDYDFTCADTNGQTVTLTVVDISGNSNAATALISVIDTIVPTVVTQNLVLYLDANGSATFDENDVDNGSTDNCAIDYMWLSDTVFYCADTATPHTITLFVRDVSGNINSATATVQVFDTLSPIVNVQTLTVYLDSFGYVGISTSQIDNSSTDNCAIDSMWLDINSFSCSAIGSAQTVSLFIRDVSGNIAANSTTVTVLDTIAPKVITQNATIYLDSTGSFSIQPSLIDNGSWDSCGIDSFNLSQSTFTCADVGANTITLFATDIHGNQSSDTATITVIDTIAPTIVLQNLVVYLDSFGQATITANSLNNGTWDSCGVANISIDSSVFSCASHGDTITIVFTATDVNGNTSFDSAFVYVLDTLPPVVMAISDTVYLDSFGQFVVDYNSLNAGTNDNCSVGLMHLSDSTFDCSGVDSTHLVWYVATDIFGNSDSLQISITVFDTISPEITCLDTLIASNDTGECGAIVHFSWPAVWDNCSIDSLLQIDSTGLDSGSFFPIGFSTLKYVAIDQSGNSDTCQFTVEVRDVQKPQLFCQADTAICDTTFLFSIPGYTDNCSGFEVIQIAGIDSGAFYPVGTTVNTFTVMDSYGNADTCSFEVLRYDYPSIADAGFDMELCAVSTTNLSGNQPAVGMGVWNLISDTAIIVDTTLNNTEINGLTIGETKFSWNISNGVCPVERDTMSVIIFSDAAISDAGENQILCDTAFAQLSALEANVGVGYWIGLNNSSSISDSLITDPLVSGLTLGDFKFVWSIENGVCPLAIDTITISVKPYPAVKAFKDEFIFAPSRVKVFAKSDIPVSFEWFPKSYITTDIDSVAYVNPPKTTEYIVFGTTEFGCTTSDTLKIGVNVNLKVPTAFTPDGDGVNDIWNVKELAAYPDCNVAVYNRWGSKMFESDGYEIPWDGTYKGEPLPSGAYFFVINLNVGEVSPITGSITIIK